MRRVYCDFNERVEDDGHIALFIDDRRIDECNPAVGEQVVLFQDEGDFEVRGTLVFRRSNWLGRAAWMVLPDCRRWFGTSTLERGVPRSLK